MPILYCTKRDNRATSEHKYYGHVVVLNTVDTKGLAKIMQANCTLKESDILACISELVDVMTTQLQNSNAVKLDGFGTFKPSISSEGAESSSKFTADNIKAVRCLFLPAGKKDVASGKINRTFLHGARFKKYSE